MTKLKSTLFNLVLTLFYMHSLLQLHLYSDLLFSNNIKHFSFFMLSLLSSFFKGPQVYKWLLYFSTLISLFRWRFIKKRHLKRFFSIRNKKITVVKRYYSIKDKYNFHSLHNTLILKKIPSFFKSFYYNWIYYYFFTFKHTFSISYEYSILFVSLDCYNNFNKETVYFYSLLKRYYNLNTSGKKKVHELYINYILNKRSNWIFINYGESINSPIVRKQSILNPMLHFFLFKSPEINTNDLFLSSWIYILKVDFFKYYYNKKSINIVCCFYLSSYNDLYYNSNTKTYHFNSVECDMTYDSQLNDLRNNVDIDSLISNFVRSKYGKLLDNDLTYSLYKLLSSLELLHEIKNIHFNLEKNMSISYDPKLIRDYNQIHSRSIFKNSKRFYMKSFLSQVKQKKPIELNFFLHPFKFDLNPLKRLDTNYKKSFSNNQKKKAHLNNINTNDSSEHILKVKEELIFSQLKELLDKPHLYLFLNVFGYDLFMGLTSTTLPHFPSSKEALATFQKNKKDVSKKVVQPIFKGKASSHVLHKQILNKNLGIIDKLPIIVLDHYELDLNALKEQIKCAVEAGDLIIYDGVQTKSIKGTNVHKLLLKHKNKLKVNLKDYTLLKYSKIEYTISPKYKDINEDNEDIITPVKDL